MKSAFLDLLGRFYEGASATRAFAVPSGLWITVPKAILEDSKYWFWDTNPRTDALREWRVIDRRSTNPIVSPG